MHVGGFTLRDYARILEATVENGYEVLPVASYLEGANRQEPYLLLRHDVDRRVENALEMARVEARHGVRSTYYFRTSTFDPDVIDAVDALGHEVGYHYEDYVRTGGDARRAHDRFERNLERFRRRVDVRTVCAHGNALSRHDNCEMWLDGPSLEDYGLLGEAYRSIDKDGADPARPTYCSDTGRSWTVTDPAYDGVTHTDGLIEFLGSQEAEGVYLLAHPGRWAVSPGDLPVQVAWDLTAEAGKRAFAPARSLGGAIPTAREVGRAGTRATMILRYMLGSR